MSDQTRLQSVIACLLDHVPGNKLNRTQLVKLVFLVDYESYIMSGETVTDVTYRYDKQGPFSWDIPDAAEDMPTVTYKQGINFFVGAVENSYTLRRDEDTFDSLSPDMEAVCKRVAQMFGDMSGKALVDYTHADPFVDRFRGGHVIKFQDHNTDQADAEAIAQLYENPELCEEIRTAEQQLRSSHRP